MGDQRTGVVVQDHVHARQAAGHFILLLPIDADRRARRVGHLQQQRTRTTSGVVDGGLGGGRGLRNTQHGGHHAADFGGCVELALALAAFGGEVAHQVFVGVAQDVVAVGTVLRKVEVRRFEDADQVAQLLDLLLGPAQQRVVVEVGFDDDAVGVFQRPDDVAVDAVADVGLALQRHHVGEAGTLGNLDRCKRLAGVFVADVLDEQHHQHVVLVLAGVHAATQFIATGPELGVEVGLLDGHGRRVCNSGRFNGWGSQGFRAAGS